LRSCDVKSRARGQTPTVCHASTLDSQLLNWILTEQSENVYENKQSRSRGVKELRSCEVKSKGRGQTPTVCHASTLYSQLLNWILTEQSENVYEKKGCEVGNGRFGGSGRPRPRQSVRSISTQTLCHCAPRLLCPLPTAHLPIYLLPLKRSIQERQRTRPGVLRGGFPVARLVVGVLKSVTGAIVLFHVN